MAPVPWVSYLRKPKLLLSGGRGFHLQAFGLAVGKLRDCSAAHLKQDAKESTGTPMLIPLQGWCLLLF